MKRYSIIAIVLLIGCMAIAAPDTNEAAYSVMFFDSSEHIPIPIAITNITAFLMITNDAPDKIQYDKGFNNALDAVTMLDLELDLKGERKTWAEKGDILRKRWNVTPRHTITKRGRYNEVS